MIIKGNIDVKYTSPKILCLHSMGEKTFYEVPWPTARSRVPKEDAVRTKGLGTEATPRRPIGTIQFWEFSREKTKVLS